MHRPHEASTQNGAETRHLTFDGVAGARLSPALGYPRRALRRDPPACGDPMAKPEQEKPPEATGGEGGSAHGSARGSDPVSSPAPEPGPAAPGARRRRWLGPLVRLALVALAFWFAWRLLRGIDWSELGDRLAEADGAWLAVTVALLFARFAVWTWRWQLAVARLGPGPGMVPLFLMIKASAVVNHLTPAARVFGGMLRARYVAGRGNGTVGRAFGGVAFDQLLHQVSMGVVTALALIGAGFATGRAGLAWITAGLLVLACGAGAAVWWRWRSTEGGALAHLARLLGRRIGGRGPARRALAEHGREAGRALSGLLRSGRLVAAMLALGGLYAVVNGAAQWTVFRALGDRPGFLVVLATVTLGTAAGTLLGTPGGLGATEAAMIATFVAFGIDRVDATAAALLYRGLHYITVFGVGTPALIWLEARRRAATD